MEVLNLMKNLSIENVPNETEQVLFKSTAAEIDKIATEIVLAEYTNKTLLIVSQYQKVGSLLLVQKDQIHNSQGTNNIFSTQVVFGCTGEEQQVAARYLAEAINIIKPLCIFINLKSYDIETVKACKDIILELKKEE